MKFFLPGAEGKEQEERVYSIIKEFLSKELGAVFAEQRYLSVRYVHDGTEYYAEVGKPHDLNGETVIAIIYDRKFRIYHVCTPNRGVARGMSILVGADSMRGDVLFDGHDGGEDE